MHKKEVAPVIPSTDMYKGNKEAPVKLVLFGDYESNETRQLNAILNGILESFEGQIKLVFRHFPMTQIHQRAHKAAEAAIGAGQEGKFWEMHELLMERPHDLGLTSLKSHAREVGVVNKKFLEQLMNSVYGWNVQDDLRAGLELGIRDIPALLVNGRFMQKPFTAARISMMIEEELKQSKGAGMKSKKKAA
jgi:protein-disulfide isomerase